MIRTNKISDVTHKERQKVSQAMDLEGQAEGTIDPQWKPWKQGCLTVFIVLGKLTHCQNCSDTSRRWEKLTPSLSLFCPLISSSASHWPNPKEAKIQAAYRAQPPVSHNRARSTGNYSWRTSRKYVYRDQGKNHEF